MLNQKIKNGKICYFYRNQRVSPSEYFELRKQLSDEKVDLMGTNTGTN